MLFRQLAEPGRPLSEISPLLEGKTQIQNKPTVYVCHNFTCSPPGDGMGGDERAVGGIGRCRKRWSNGCRKWIFDSHGNDDKLLV